MNNNLPADTFTAIVKNSIGTGVHKGLKVNYDILKIMLPVSFIMTILNTFGIFAYIIKPFLSVSSLTGFLVGSSFIC